MKRKLNRRKIKMPESVDLEELEEIDEKVEEDDKDKEVKKPKKETPKTKTRKKRERTKRYEFYESKDESINRLKKSCPRCGPGVFMANHNNRIACGSCGYTEFKQES